MKQIQTKGIANSAITNAKIASGAVSSDKLAAGAMQGVLESKLAAFRVGILSFLPALGGDDVVTAKVTAAATTLTPRTALTAKGVYVGTVTGATDIKKVVIRAAGTDNGIDDGTGDEIYGVLTEDATVYTLTYKKADGTAYTFAAETSIDFFFVEVFDLYSAPVDRFLMAPVGGVIDATMADALVAHVDDTADAHNASAISVSGTATNYTAASADVEAHLAGIHTALGTKATQVELDDTQGAIGAFIGGDGIVDGFTGTTYLEGELTLTNALIELDTQLAAVAGTVSSSFSDADFEVYATGAATKKMAFNVSGVTAGQTRTVTIPDRSVDLGKVLASDVEILAALDGTDITNKYKDLVFAGDVINPSTSLLNVYGVEADYTADYTIITDTTYIRRINWSGLALDGVLVAGDVLKLRFSKY